MQPFYNHSELFNAERTIVRSSMEYEVAPGQSVSTRLLEAVADIEETDPAELNPPLYEVIDPDALEALFDAPASGSELERTGQLAFPYRGYRITVSFGRRQTISIDDEPVETISGRDGVRA